MRLSSTLPATQMPWTWATSIYHPFRRQMWSIEVRWTGGVDAIVEEAFSLIAILRRPHIRALFGPGARVKARRLR